MSKEQSQKEQKPKIERRFEDVPLLADLGLPALKKEYKAAAWEAAKAKERMDDTRQALLTVVDAAEADSVLYDDWRFTAVRPGPGSKLSMAKLKLNLGKMGKLDAALIVKILNASKTATKPKSPFIKVTAPEGELPKKKKEEETEDDNG